VIDNSGIIASVSGSAKSGGINAASSPKEAAKQVETIFLNEIMRVMMEQTSFGKDRTVSSFLPVITSEISKSIVERGIGVGEFFLRGKVFDRNSAFSSKQDNDNAENSASKIKIKI
jgi:Rod binding domain-containing protein